MDLFANTGPTFVPTCLERENSRSIASCFLVGGGTGALHSVLGAHLLLFFLAFVFGSFCTFCFHMLMYLFDEKCVLFPKLLSLTSLKHNVIYEFIPSNKDVGDMPVDFLSTQWVEKSTCSLPTYVPLVSGIFGLVWTTMFLMCSTGSRTLTGLQRPWRVLPPVFVFSLAMGGLCIYSSVVTHAGLQDLCYKLGEITGSPTCTYTVNVATLTYERRIRGVYQATRLTILSAWLHTACWLLSALLTLVRVILAVDFLLVRVSVELHGDIDRMMERNEVQIRTVLPDSWTNVESECASSIIDIGNVKRKDDYEDILTELMEQEADVLFLANHRVDSSELSLVPEESRRISRKEAVKRVPKDKAFIVNWLHDLLDHLHLPDLTTPPLEERTSSPVSLSLDSHTTLIPTRQLGQVNISLHLEYEDEVKPAPTQVDSIEFYQASARRTSETIKFRSEASPKASTSQAIAEFDNASKWNLDVAAEVPKKSILKTVGVQTGKDKKSVSVRISENTTLEIKSDDDDETPSSANKNNVDKETQTKQKEKQD